jgi:hypothetical protein
MARFPLLRRFGGPQGRSGRMQKIPLPSGFDPRTVQPVASRSNDYAIPTHAHNTHTRTHAHIHINVIQLQKSIIQYTAHTSTTLCFPAMYGVCFVPVTEQNLEFWWQLVSNETMNCLVWGTSSVPKTNRNFRKIDVFPSSVEIGGKHLLISWSRAFYGSKPTSCSPRPCTWEMKQVHFPKDRVLFWDY